MAERDRIARQPAFALRDLHAGRKRRAPQIRRQRDGKNSGRVSVDHVVLKDQNRTSPGLLRAARGVEIGEPDAARINTTYIAGSIMKVMLSTRPVE
jgi:hypothetical protein